MDVRIVESVAGFADLEAAFERLAHAATATSIFESFDWQLAWWRTYGKDRPLRLLVATEADAVVGILALYVDATHAAGVPVRLLRLVGTGGDTFPDDLGAILDPSCELAAARALADAVVALAGWDVLSLTDLMPDSAFTAAIAAAVGASRLRHRTGRSERIAFLDLPATWEEWLSSLHRDRRYRVKSARKKLLAAHPDARFFVWKDAATLDAGFDRLVHLHRKRWERAGSSHSFASPEYLAFHRCVMADCLRRDRLRLYCLEVGGEIIAMYYFYRFRDRVYLMQSGFDPDYAEWKPGQVLLGYVIEDAIGEKMRVVDFLRGDHRYKDELATGARETVYVTAFRARPAAWAYELRRERLPALKAAAVRRWRALSPPPEDGPRSPAPGEA